MVCLSHVLNKSAPRITTFKGHWMLKNSFAGIAPRLQLNERIVTWTKKPYD